MCDLACVKFKAQDEFIGPVKIVVEDRAPGEECLRQWTAAITALGLFLLGGSTLIVIICTFTMYPTFLISSHMFLGTIGMHLITPIGIITVNEFHGPAMVGSRACRVWEHIITHVFGTACGALCFFIVFVGLLNWSISGLFTVHSGAGCIGLALNVVAMVFGGLNAIFPNPNWTIYKKARMIHGIFAIGSIVFSGAGFISGITKDPILVWFDSIHYSVVYFVVSFSATAQIIICFAPISRW